MLLIPCCGVGVCVSRCTLEVPENRAIAALTLSPGPTIGEASGACGPELALMRSLLGHGMFSSEPAMGFEEGTEHFRGIPLFQRWANFLSLCACWLPSVNTTGSISAAFSESSLYSRSHRTRIQALPLVRSQTPHPID